ncbi:MAG: tRNA1(Val) (adenine(37)-N6)-methyltransferase [Alkalilacustris sp.]
MALSPEPEFPTTDDSFLGGRLRVLQPRHGYRAATDPVLLAAAVPARVGQSVLELGCGVGVASLCLGARLPGLRLTGLERQAEYAALARMNAARNGCPLTVCEGCVTELPAALVAQDFDHVLANPPWFRATDPGAADPGRDAGRREETPLGAWIATGLRRLRTGGRLTLILPTARLPDALAALGTRASVAVRPLAPRIGRAPTRIILQARKGGRAPFTLGPPLILHAGPRHLQDADDYSPEAQAILRDAAPLSMG